MGVPLTDVMEFTDRDGTPWLAFVDVVPTASPDRWRRQTMLAPRRLRFNSASGSRVTTPVPAGAPFLTEARLQGLLDQAASLEAAEVGATPTRAARVGGAALATLALAGAARHWKQGARRRHALRNRAAELAVLTGDRVVGWVTSLLRGRPRARF